MNILFAVLFAVLGAGAGYLGAACTVASCVKFFDYTSPASWIEAIFLFGAFLIAGCLIAGFITFYSGVVAGAIALGAIAFGAPTLASLLGSLLHAHHHLPGKH